MNQSDYDVILGVLKNSGIEFLEQAHSGFLYLQSTKETEDGQVPALRFDSNGKLVGFEVVD